MAMNAQGRMTAAGVPPSKSDPLDQTVWVGSLCTNVRAILDWKREAEMHDELVIALRAMVNKYGPDHSTTQMTVWDRAQAVLKKAQA